MPIPHVALVALVLFIFGRITSVGDGGTSPVGLPTPTLTKAHAAGDATLIKRVETAEREREQYKSLYQEKETELNGALSSIEEASDCEDKLKKETETKIKFAKEVEASRRELAEKTKQAVKEAALGVADMNNKMEKMEHQPSHQPSKRDIPAGREFSNHQTGVSGNSETMTLGTSRLSRLFFSFSAE